MSLSRKIYIGILIVSVVLLAIFFDLVIYGVRQGIGQVSIVWKAKPVNEYLQNPSFPDSLKTKLRLVEKIRQFAFDSLGINYSDNYTMLYDQQGKPILWVVTASEQYNLKAKEWQFPFLGSVAYKGFFDHELALEEAALLKSEGWETSVDEVAGWSTLGWFKDPILSSMLAKGPGSLANLIIHELTHGTLYVKNNVDFNENLASFVGDHGASLFLKQRYGAHSPELKKYEHWKEFYKKYSVLVLSQSKALDSLYKSFPKQMNDEEKQRQKEMFFQKSIAKILSLYHVEGFYFVGLEKKLQKINNTFYMDEQRYKAKQNHFEQEFKTKFNSNFKTYFAYLKEKYPSL